GIHRALKLGKKFAALVLATADESPLIALPMAIAARHAGAPQAPFDDPGLFALGGPAVLAAAYRDAGFSQVAVESALLQRRLPSLAVAVQTVRDLLPEISELLARAAVAAAVAALAEIGGGVR